LKYSKWAFIRPPSGYGQVVLGAAFSFNAYHGPMNATMPTAILLIEDDALVRASLALALRLAGYLVLEAGTGAEGLAQLAEAEAVILDVLLPDQSGFAVLEAIRLRGQWPVLMLTALDELEYKLRGLRAGADDYVVKPYALSEVLARLEALLRRSQAQSQAQAGQASFAGLRLDPQTLEVWREGRAITLTPKGFRLLELLLAHPKRVLAREALMQAVWGESVDANTLDALIASTRRALGEPSLIQTIRGVGYALRTPKTLPASPTPGQM
jgi:DNA-binding response OmpR family regulator